MVLLYSTVYLQLRRETYNTVTFSVKLLSRIPTFHQYSCHFIILYYILHLHHHILVFAQ